MTTDTYGPGSLTPSPSSDPASWYSRTLGPISSEVSASWPQTLPRSGTASAGHCSALPTSVPPTDGSDCSSLRLLKTPTSNLGQNGGPQHPDKRKAGGHGPTLEDEIYALTLQP